MNQGLKSFFISALGAAVTVLVIPAVLIGLSNYYIPNIIERSNKTEALRVSKLKKALDIGDRNKEFDSRLNVLKTRIDTFNRQNIRMALSLNQLRQAQDEFRRNYTNDYLELDKIAWWWYWEIEREAQIFDLLSSEELTILHDLLLKYAGNIAKSVGAISPPWEYLSSSRYRVDNNGQKRTKDLEGVMLQSIDDLSHERAQLIKKMSSLFAQSQHVPAEK